MSGDGSGAGSAGTSYSGGSGGGGTSFSNARAGINGGNGGNTGSEPDRYWLAGGAGNPARNWSCKSEVMERVDF